MKKLFISIGLVAIYSLSSSGQLMTTTGNLNAARTDHQSQLLNNGQVLAFGGNNGDLLNIAYFNSAELYNPTVGSWSATGSMNDQRDDFASVLLDNGNVLAIGGMDGTNYLNSCEIYDVGTGTWSFTDTLAFAISDHRAIKLDNGDILAVYGNISQLYSQTSNTWSLGDSLTNSVTNFALVKLSDGKILMTSINLAEIYDPATDTWSVIPNSMVESRSFHTSILMSNGKVLITGGSGLKSSEVFDPSNNTFTASVNMMENFRSDCKMINLANGNVLIWGIGDFFNFFDTKCLEVYNPILNIWASAGTLSVLGASSYTVHQLNTNKMLFSGGNFTTGNGASDQCYLVDENSIVIVGVEDAEYNTVDNAVHIYPNPGNEMIYIKTSIDIETIELYDNTSRKVSTTLVDQAFEEIYPIDTSNLNPGVYFLTVRHKAGLITRRIVL